MMSRNGIVIAMKVRLAVPEDAEQIAQLSGQLGYPASTGETLQRLAEISGYAEHAVYVSDEDGTLPGWIHVAVAPSLLACKRAEIVGLVVHEQHRGRGVGRALMEQAEQWAKEMDCISVRLRSNVQRDGAHAFYEKSGYRFTKLQKAFSKELA